MLCCEESVVAIIVFFILTLKLPFKVEHRSRRVGLWGPDAVARQWNVISVSIHLMLSVLSNEQGVGSFLAAPQTLIMNFTDS